MASLKGRKFKRDRIGRFAVAGVTTVAVKRPQRSLNDRGDRGAWLNRRLDSGVVRLFGRTAADNRELRRDLETERRDAGLDHFMQPKSEGYKYKKVGTRKDGMSGLYHRYTRTGLVFRSDSRLPAYPSPVSDGPPVVYHGPSRGWGPRTGGFWRITGGTRKR